MFQVLESNKTGQWAAISNHDTKEAAELAKETARQTDKTKWYKIARANADQTEKPQPTTAAPAATIERPTIKTPTAKTPAKQPIEKPTNDQAAAILERLATIENSLKTILEKLANIGAPTIETPAAIIETPTPKPAAKPKTPKTAAQQFKITATGIIETEIICDEKDVEKTLKSLKSHALLMQSKIKSEDITMKTLRNPNGSIYAEQKFCDPSQHMKVNVQKIA